MRIRGLIAVALCALLPLSLTVIAGEEAGAQEDVATISASMNSYYYVPGEIAYLDVDLELSGEARTDTLYLELVLYPSVSTRSQLSAFREGARRHIIARRRLETIAPDSEWTDKMYEVDLKMLGLSTGVYPFEVRLLRRGEAIASDTNFLVIMDPAIGYPLNLSLLWTMDFLPSTDAQGNALDTGLASACSSSTSGSGFLYNLVRTMEKTPEVKGSVVMPGATYADLKTLADMAEGGSGSDMAEGATAVLAGLDRLFKGGQLDLVSTTYAFADPDILASPGWEGGGQEVGEEEAVASSQLGLGVAFARGTASGGTGFVAPLFHLSDFVLPLLVEEDVEFVVVGREALEASAAGRRLLEGTTLSQPVRFVSSDGYTLKAFVRDEVLYAYLENVQGADASHIIQNIFAELAALQREKPSVVRSCVLAFPPSFMPGQEFLNEFYDAVKACPWAQTRRLAELNADQFPLEDVTLQAPVYPEAPSDFMPELEAVRSEIGDFTSALPADHELRKDLRLSLFIAENYRFTGDRDTAAARSYLGSIRAVIAGETDKVNIALKRSVTLSSTQGKLSVDVNSALEYPLENVTLRMENPNLTFPEGSSREVTVEPRENRFIFDVNTRRKGSFIVDIVLESGDLVIASTSTTLNTSIINTLAIILLACLAGIVALSFLVRRLVRGYRGGKHSRGRTKE